MSLRILFVGLFICLATASPTCADIVCTPTNACDNATCTTTSGCKWNQTSECSGNLCLYYEHGHFIRSTAPVAGVCPPFHNLCSPLKICPNITIQCHFPNNSIIPAAGHFDVGEECPFSACHHKDIPTCCLTDGDCSPAGSCDSASCVSNSCVQTSTVTSPYCAAEFQTFSSSTGTLPCATLPLFFSTPVCTGQCTSFCTIRTNPTTDTTCDPNTQSSLLVDPVTLITVIYLGPNCTGTTVFDIPFGNCAITTTNDFDFMVNFCDSFTTTTTTTTSPTTTTTTSTTTLPSCVSLDFASPFAVLGASTVTNTGPTIITGDLGLYPGTSVTGAPVVTGSEFIADSEALNARHSLTTAITTLNALTCTTDLSTINLGGLTLIPGVYCYSSSAQLTGTLTLNGQGNPNATFVFQIGSTLTTAPSSVVRLVNGSSECNIYWVLGSSATLNTASSFLGNILAAVSITLDTGATIVGRALARTGAVTMDSNNITICETCGLINVTFPNTSTTSVTTNTSSVTSDTDADVEDADADDAGDADADDTTSEDADADDVTTSPSTDEVTENTTDLGGTNPNDPNGPFSQVWAAVIVISIFLAIIITAIILGRRDGKRREENETTSGERATDFGADIVIEVEDHMFANDFGKKAGKRE